MEEQVSADLVFYRPTANGIVLADMGAASEKENKKNTMERTPQLEPGLLRRPMRSLPPLPVNVEDAAGPSISKLSGLVRGETAPPYSGTFHLSGIFPLPIRTPEPEANQLGGDGVQTIMPRFLSGPTSLQVKLQP